MSNKDNQQSEFGSTLYDIRKHKNSVLKLVKELEGDVPNDVDDPLDFCRRYTIFIFKRYCRPPDDREFILAVWGFLRGEEFQAKKIGDRIKAYWKLSHKYNEIFLSIKTDSSIQRIASENMSRIINALITEVKADLVRNNNKLGLIDDVRKDSELLEILEPRKTEKTSSFSEEVPPLTLSPLINDDIEDTVSEDIDDESLHGVSSKAKINDIEEKTMSNNESADFATDSEYCSDDEEGKSGSTKIKTESSESVNPKSDDTEGKGGRSKTRLRDKIKQLFCGLSPKDKMFSVALTIVAVFSICCRALILFSHNTQKNEDVKEAMDDAERISPTSIEIKNRYIQLYPGDDDYLIVMVTPKEIDIQDLDYTSSEASVVTADKNHITALYGWNEDACHDIEITVQGGGRASATAEVTVLKPKDLDGTENASVGGGGNSYDGGNE